MPAYDYIIAEDDILVLFPDRRQNCSNKRFVTVSNQMSDIVYIM